jgi:hypothetical protein
MLPEESLQNIGGIFQRIDLAKTIITAIMNFANVFVGVLQCRSVFITINPPERLVHLLLVLFF